jgi:hypothetical protein
MEIDTNCQPLAQSACLGQKWPAVIDQISDDQNITCVLWLFSASDVINE